MTPRVLAGFALPILASAAGLAAAGASAASAPRLSPVAMSHKIWREGSRYARLSSAAVPVGTMFSFSVDTAAVIKLRLSNARSGRTVATLTFPHGHAGLNELRFEGRLSSTRRLSPGRYTAHISARNGAGETRASGLGFTIVRG